MQKLGGIILAMTHEEVLVGKPIVVPHDTSDEDFGVESKEQSIESIDEKPQEEHK
jgi:hypothetical protein